MPACGCENRRWRTHACSVGCREKASLVRSAGERGDPRELEFKKMRRLK